VKNRVCIVICQSWSDEHRKSWV